MGLETEIETAPDPVDRNLKHALASTFERDVQEFVAQLDSLALTVLSNSENLSPLLGLISVARFRHG
jgi:hypothetical protein